MTYSKIKKGIASILIAALLAPNLVGVDFSYGDDLKKEHDLVVLLVEKDLFSSGDENKATTLTGKIYRYANDIRLKSNNTKTKIIKVDKNQHPSEIQHVLEKFYLEGEEDAQNTEINKLKGVVLIGDLPFPVVKYKEYYLPTVYPYTDFVDPAFIWDEFSQQFIINTQSAAPQSEIWHGIIQAPGVEDKTEELKQYFDKNHAFHSGKVASKFNQKIFYADVLEENKKSNSDVLGNYFSRNRYIEDLAYLRFNKHFADKVLGNVEGNTGDSSGIPDLQSKEIIEKFLSPYAEVVENYVQYMNTFVEGSGRWTKKDVDSFPALITKIDALFLDSNAPVGFDLSLKNINTHMDKALDELVEKTWQKDITMLAEIRTKKDFGMLGNRDVAYENFLNGTSVKDIKSAEDCSLYQGTPNSKDQNFAQQVEFNRLYDPSSAGKEEDACDPYGGCCGNNLLSPEKCDPENSIQPVKNTVANVEKEGLANPLACKKINLISPKYGYTYENNKIRDYSLKTFSSVFKHNEPRNETIANALSNPNVQSNLPVDNQRYISFQNQGSRITDIQYFNFYDIENTSGKNDLETVKNIVNANISAYGKYINQKTTQQNLDAYKEYLNSYISFYSANSGYNTNVNVSHPTLGLQPSSQFEVNYTAWENETLTFVNSKINAENSFNALTNYLKSGQTNYDSELNSIFRAYFPSEEYLTFFDFVRQGGANLNLVRIESGAGSLLSGISYSLNDIISQVQKSRKHDDIEIKYNKSFSTVNYLPENYWSDQLKAYGEENVYTVVQWLNATLDEKHQIVFENYINQVDTPYVPSAEDGYESLYLRADGNLDYLDLSIKNSPTQSKIDLPNFDNTDLEWAESLEEIKSVEEKEFEEIMKKALEDKASCGSLTEGVDLIDWWDSIECWLDDLGGTSSSNPYPSESVLEAEQEFENIQKTNPEIQIFLSAENEALTNYNEWQKVFVQVADDVDLESVEIAISQSEGGEQGIIVGNNPVKLSDGKGITYVKALTPGSKFVVYVKDQTEYQGNTIQLTGSTSDKEIQITKNTQEVKEDISIDAQNVSLDIASLAKQKDNKLVFVNTPQHIDYNSDVNILVELQNAEGSPIKSDVKVEVQLTEASQKYASLYTTNLLDFSTGSNQLVSLKTLRESGPIHLLLNSKNETVASTGIEIKVANLLTKEEISDLKPQALYATLLGESYADLAQTDTIANSLLFSKGKTQAVTTLQGKIENHPVGLNLFPNGSLEVFNEKYQPVLTNLLPLQIGIYNQSNLEKELSYEIGFQDDVETMGEFSYAVDFEKTGIYLDIFEKEFLTLEQNKNNLLLKKNTEEVLEITKKGKIILNPNYQMSVNTTSDNLLLDVVFEGEVIAQVVLAQAEIMQVLQKSKNVSQFFAEANTQGKIGFSIVDSSIEKQIINLNQAESLISAKKTKGVGWKGDYKNQLLFAANNTVGNSTQNYNSVFEVLLGDPTIKIKETTTASSNGFNQTVGKQIATNHSQQVAKTLNLDFNADNYADIAVIYEDGYIELLQGTVSHEFENKGKLAYFADSIQDAQVIDFHQDGFEDILLITPKNELVLLQNENDEFVSQAINLNLPSHITQFELALMSGDKNLDLVTAMSNGEVLIYYGNAEGTFTATGVSVDQLGGKIKNINLAEEVLLSYVNMPSVSEDNQFELELSKDSSTIFIPGIQDSSFTIDKRGKSLAGEYLDKESVIEYTTTLQSAVSKNGIKLTNEITANFNYLSESLQINNCGENVNLEQRVRMNEYPFLISNIDLSPAETCEIKYQVQVTQTPEVRFWLEDVSVDSYSADGHLDIGVSVEGNTSGKIKYLISQEPRAHEYLEIFTEKEEPDDLASFNEDADGNGVPDRMEKDADGNGIPDYIDDINNQKTADQDGDGLPDAWDKSVDRSDFHYISWDDIWDEVSASLDNVTEFLEGGCQGGCLNIPINYAFFVPGPVLGGGLGTFSERLGIDLKKDLRDSPAVLPIFAWGKPDICVLPGTPCVPIPQPIWLPAAAYAPLTAPCTCGTPLMPKWSTSWQNTAGRIYLSPTLTGGIGTAVCMGKYPNGRCFVTTADSIVGNLCDAVGLSDDDIKSQSVQTVSKGGQSLFSVGGGTTSQSGGGSKNTGGYAVEFGLSDFSFSKTSNINRHVKEIGGVLTTWVNRQLEEVANALLDLPTVNLYYPNFDRTFDIDEAPNKNEDGVVAIEEGAIKNAYDSTEDLVGIKGAFETVKSIPFVTIKRKDLNIKFSYIDKKSLNQTKQDLEGWLDDAKKEMKDTKKAWQKAYGKEEDEKQSVKDILWDSKCEASGTDLTADCKQRLALFSMVVEADKAMKSVEKNLEALESYANFPREVVKYKKGILMYLTQVTHQLNQIMDSMGGWIVRNTIRYNLWKQMILTINEIRKGWQEILDVMVDYKNSCETCQAESYQFDVWSMVGGALPEVPVVQFPRWPDIKIDLSQINTNYTVVLPRLHFIPTPLVLPKIPRLQLPKAPTFDMSFSLPGIPVLPELPSLPELPDLPSFTLPNLPDLPPPPKIPAISDKVSGSLDLIDKLLNVYCLIKKGLWAYDEKTLKSTIENMTARPSGFIDGFDFLHLNTPSWSISGYDLLVESRVNLKANSDFVEDKVVEFTNDWNAYLKDAIGDVKDKTAEIYEDVTSHLDIDYKGDVKEKMDEFEDYLDGVEEDIDDKTQDIQDSVKDAEKSAEKRTDSAEGRLNNIENTMQQPSDSVQEQGDDALNNAEEHLEVKNTNGALTQIVEDMQEAIDQQAEFRITPEVVADLDSSNLRRMKKFSGIILDYQTELEQEIKALEESDSLSAIAYIPEDDSFKLASNQEDSDLPIQTEKVQYYSSISQQEIAELRNPQTQRYLAQVDTSNSSIVNSEDNSEQGASPEYKGAYLYDEATDQTQPLLDFAEEADTVKALLFLDYDDDGDEDIVYSMGADLYLKESYKKNKTSFEPYKNSPQVADFDSLTIPLQAIKNYKVEKLNNTTVTVAWRQYQHSQNSGYLIENANVISLNALINKNYFYLTLSPETLNITSNGKNLEVGDVVAGPNTLTINNNFVLDLKENENFSVGLNDGETYKFNLENDFYYSAIYAVLNNGRLSTRATQSLLAPQISADTMAPIVSAPREMDIYLKQTKSISNKFFIDDSENLILDWSTETPQEVAVEENEFVIGPYDKITNFKIDLKVSDEAGNETLGQTKVNIIPPGLTLKKKRLIENKIVSGLTEPLIKNIPVSIYRERFGKTKLIRTPSANSNHKYLTNGEAQYSVDDFDLDPGVIVKDSTNKEIAYIHAPTGQIELKEDGYSTKAIPAGKNFPTRVVILNSENKIVANQYFVADYNNDVSLDDFSFNSGNVSGLNGVHVFDANTEDQYKFASLPGNAPYFPGGLTVFNEADDKTVSLINVDGRVHIPATSEFNLFLKRSDYDEPVVFEIRDNANSVIGEIYVAVPERDDILEILPDEHWGDLLTQIFIPFQKIAKPMLVAASDGLKELPFADINPNHPAYEAVKELYERNILQGYEDGSVRPDSKISRAEFVKIALGATSCLDCTMPTDAEKSRYDLVQPFPDVFASAWYYYCVSKGKEKRMITGYGDGYFRPEQNISRAEAVAILLREAGVNIDTMPVNYFLDVQDYAWYKDYVYTGVQLGIISSNYSFVNPDEKITRGEFAMMANNLLDIQDCRLTDTDGDGMPDYWEIQNGLNPNFADAALDNDGDGIANLKEFINGTDPNQEEVCPYLNNPNKTDTDKDGTIDVCDDDIDNDSVKNLLNIYNLEGQIDEAKVNISTDNCVFVSNVSQEDQDSDGKGDACDIVEIEEPEEVEVVEPVVEEDDIDLCPNIPGNNRGCPSGDDYDLADKDGIFIVPGDTTVCYFIDYAADIHTGDKIFTAVSSEDNKDIWSRSEVVEY